MGTLQFGTVIYLPLIISSALAGIYLPKTKYVIKVPETLSPGDHMGTIYVMKNDHITCAIANTDISTRFHPTTQMKVSSTISEERIILTVEKVPKKMNGTIYFNISLGCTDENDRGINDPQLWEAAVIVEVIPVTSKEYKSTDMDNATEMSLIYQCCPSESLLFYNILENSPIGPMDTFEGYHRYVPREGPDVQIKMFVHKNSTRFISLDNSKSSLSMAVVPDYEKNKTIQATIACHVSSGGQALRNSPALRTIMIRVLDVDDNPPKPIKKRKFFSVDKNSEKGVKDVSVFLAMDQDSETTTNDKFYEVTLNDTDNILDVSTSYLKVKTVTFISLKIAVDSKSITLPYIVDVKGKDKMYRPAPGKARKNNEVTCTLTFDAPDKRQSVPAKGTIRKVDLDYHAAKYALVAQLTPVKAVINNSADVQWKVVNIIPPTFKRGVNVSANGEVYVYKDNVLKRYVDISSPLVKVALEVNGIHRQFFSLSITVNDDRRGNDNTTCDQGCSIYNAEDVCTSACGYGAVTGRCEWQETCSPNLATCPDGFCSDLERMHSEICPQDCSITKNSSSDIQLRGIPVQCKCDTKFKTPDDCQCVEQEQTGEEGSVDSQNSNGTLKDMTVSDTRCASACRAGIAASVLVFLFLFVAVVAGRIFWKRRQEQRQLPSLKHVNSLVSMSAIPSDYIVDDSRDSRGHVNRQTLSPASGHWSSKTTGNYTHEMIEDEWEFPRHNLSLENIIGEGEFGQVVKANATMTEGQESGVKIVAVKMLKPDASGAEYQDLVSEFQMLKEVDHPNVIKLLGVCTQKGPLYVIVEFCELGSLRSFLRASKFKNKGSWEEKQKSGSHFTESQEMPVDRILTSRNLFSFAWQISKGMDYLSGLKIVHRDLAARNVLVKEGWQIKISDFGLSRDVYEANKYVKMSKGRFPVKWMAPESLYGQIYTTKSDTWSYGIVLWEIVTLGASPYPGIPPERLYPLLSTGYRMDRPEDCPEELYAIMQKCWKSAPEDRPSFAVLRDILDHILQQNTGYLELPDNSTIHPFDDFPSFRKQVSGDKRSKSSSTTRFPHTADDTFLDKPPAYGNIIDLNGQPDPNSAPEIPVTMRQWHADEDESDRESCPESSKLLDDGYKNSQNNLYGNSCVLVKKQSNILGGVNKNSTILCPRIGVHENLTYA